MFGKKKKTLFRVIIGIWVVLWLFFLVREDKDDQYGDMMRLFKAGRPDKYRLVLGPELYDLLVLCKESMPLGSTYKLSGFEKFSIHEVRARYFLWSLVSVDKDPDYVIYFKSDPKTLPGYERCGGSAAFGSLYRKIRR